MLIVDDNPGHVSVSWVQFVSGDGDAIHQFVALGSVGASVDDIPVHSIFYCASLSLGIEISGVIF